MNDEVKRQAIRELLTEFPACLSGEECDGDLGEDHEPHCPAKGMPKTHWPEVAVRERSHVIESAAKIAALENEIDLRVEQGKALNGDKERFKKLSKALENQLSEAMVAHGKTLLLLHTAAYETIPTLERRCLIVEMALRSECGPDESLYRELLAVAEGKLPQIEVKP